MHAFRRTVSTAFSVLLMTLPVLAQQPGASTSPPISGMANMPPGTTQASSPADQAMMSGMKTMGHDMDSVPMTGDPDHDFVAMMIPHHKGAVDMARVELQYGKDRTMRNLALLIISAQKKEIAQMQRWQTAHHGAP